MCRSHADAINLEEAERPKYGKVGRMEEATRLKQTVYDRMHKAIDANREAFMAENDAVRAKLAAQKAERLYHDALDRLVNMVLGQ